MPDREWVQSDRRTENPRIRKEEDELSSIPGYNKVNWMRRKKVKQFSAPGMDTTSIPLKNPEGVRGGGGSGGGGSEGEDTKWVEGG